MLPHSHGTTGTRRALVGVNRNKGPTPIQHMLTMRISNSSVILIILLASSFITTSQAFLPCPSFSTANVPSSSYSQDYSYRHRHRHRHSDRHRHRHNYKYGSHPHSHLYSTNEDDDANRWISTDETYEKLDGWESDMQARKDGSLWSSFSPEEESSKESGSETSSSSLSSNSASGIDALDDGEAWLDALASVAADEIEFINTEAERADKARQMQEWGFEAETIKNALGVEVDDSNEIDEDDEVFEKFKEETRKTGFGMYLDDEVDPLTVESHSTVQREEETNELVRTQMVYVDEHTCIGCTHCAMIAQSTFFMEPELGRARVFQQWGDDQETIEIAIETCPVDCIHYVPYEELEKLEVDRRGQRINNTARLVNQSEGGGGIQPRSFTAPQAISGNMGSRCNNCPSRGCSDCPMFGVGKNPNFEEKEKERKEKMAKRRMKKRMEEENRSAEL